jgi:hypothetical protein
VYFDDLFSVVDRPRQALAPQSLHHPSPRPISPPDFFLHTRTCDDKSAQCIPSGELFSCCSLFLQVAPNSDVPSASLTTHHLIHQPVQPACTCSTFSCRVACEGGPPYSIFPNALRLRRCSIFVSLLPSVPRPLSGRRRGTPQARHIDWGTEPQAEAVVARLSECPTPGRGGRIGRCCSARQVPHRFEPPPLLPPHKRPASVVSSAPVGAGVGAGRTAPRPVAASHLHTFSPARSHRLHPAADSISPPPRGAPWASPVAESEHKHERGLARFGGRAPRWLGGRGLAQTPLLPPVPPRP